MSDDDDTARVGIEKARPDETTARVRCAHDPRSISPQVRGSIGEIATVVAADWRRMMTLAEDAAKQKVTVYDALGAPVLASLPGPEWHDALARSTVLVTACKRLGFAIEPPEGWTCRVRGCTLPVGHGGRCEWMTGRADPLLRRS